MAAASSAAHASSSIPHGFPIIWRSKVSTEEYERVRVGRVFNHRRPDRYPIAVVEPTCDDHVVTAVQIARENNARVSVRSGGHSWAAWSVRDNAILIDFGNYKQLDYDEDKKIAIVSPSTTGRVLNHFLGEKGMLFAGGHCPDVGVGGFLLQGGMGWCCRVCISSCTMLL
jgi:FAD/FMN-containing dehydrogenase